MKFNPFEKLLPPENKVFYECFEDSAKNSNKLAKLFEDALLNGMTEEKIIKAKTLKHRGSSLERETIRKLNSTFVTPIDREDIQALAIMLNKISKKLGQAAVNLNVYRITDYTDEMLQQAKTIVNATNELITCVGLLKTISKTKEVTESREAMKEIETFGDSIHYRAMDSLFSGSFKPLEVIKLRDIYGELESALDKCFSVADMVLNIALKNN